MKKVLLAVLGAALLFGGVGAAYVAAPAGTHVVCATASATVDSRTLYVDPDPVYTIPGAGDVQTACETFTDQTVTVTTTVQPPPPPPAPPPPPVPPPPPPPPPVCTRTQAGGNLQAFADSLAAGETGCISGTFTAGLVVGQTHNGFTLRNTPNLALNISRTGGAFSTIEVYGDNVTLYGLDVNGLGTKNCVLFGYGFEQTPAMKAVNDTLDHVRLHGCGNDAHEHGIYAEGSSNLHVMDSIIYGAGGFGIQFYPEADDSLIEYTIIDGNDLGSDSGAGNVIFAGETAGGEYSQKHQSDRNIIRNSIVSFASPGSNTNNILTYWPGSPDGVGNGIQDSCLWSPGDVENGGDNPFATLTNITRVDPQYTDRANGNYNHSACAGYGPR